MAQRRCEHCHLSTHHKKCINFLSVTSCVKFRLILLLQCLAKVREAFTAVEAALMGENSSQVARDFSCCQIPKNLDDQVMELCFYALRRLVVWFKKGEHLLFCSFTLNLDTFPCIS